MRRKIIKNIGIATISDEEVGDDFLQPIKSEGCKSNFQLGNGYKGKIHVKTR